MKWNKTTDKLPQPNETVLGITENMDYIVLDYCGNQFYDYNNNETVYNNNEIICWNKLKHIDKIIDKLGE